MQQHWCRLLFSLPVLVNGFSLVRQKVGKKMSAKGKTCGLLLKQQEQQPLSASDATTSMLQFPGPMEGDVETANIALAQ